MIAAHSIADPLLEGEHVLCVGRARRLLRSDIVHVIVSVVVDLIVIVAVDVVGDVDLDLDAPKDVGI